MLWEVELSGVILSTSSALHPATRPLTHSAHWAIATIMMPVVMCGLRLVLHCFRLGEFFENPSAWHHLPMSQPFHAPGASKSSFVSLPTKVENVSLSWIGEGVRLSAVRGWTDGLGDSQNLH